MPIAWSDPYGRRPKGWRRAPDWNKPSKAEKRRIEKVAEESRRLQYEEDFLSFLIIGGLIALVWLIVVALT